MYKLILLDADDTLFDYTTAEKNSLVQAFSLYGIEVNESIYKQFKNINSKLWKDMEAWNLTKASFRALRFKELFQRNDFKIDPVVFNRSYLELLSNDATLLPGAEKLCQTLSDDFILVVLTNGFKRIQESRIRESKINDYIDRVIVSEEAGANKPHPDIFRYALNEMNHHEPYTVIMIGNSITSDIKGGIDFGIDTCWLNIDGEQPREGIKPTYEVNSLIDIIDILK